MASPSTKSTDGDAVLTTEQFMDLLSSKSPSELASLQRLRVKAYPFPLYPSKNAGSYTTFSFEDLLPLFPGLALQSLEVQDAYHGPDVAEDGWGHNVTNGFIEHMIKKSTCWKELIFESQSDRWLEPVCFTRHAANGVVSEEVHGRDPQPQTWDEMMKARDGEDSGAGVEMWSKEIENGAEWVKIQGSYKSSAVEIENDGGSGSTPAPEPSTVEGNDIAEDIAEDKMSATQGEDDDADDDEDDDEEEEERSRPAIKIRITRGDGVDYKQEGYKALEATSYGTSHGLYKIFENSNWEQIKKDLFITGAEDDPTAHL